MIFQRFVFLSLLSQCMAISTTTASNSRDCGFNFVCERGFCHPTIPFLCQCETNWIGALCDIFSCPPDCKCSTSLGTVNCSTQQSDSSESPMGTTPTSSTEQQTFTSLTTSRLEVRKLNVCKADYELRPVSQRECVPGFRCKYGVCQLDASSDTHLAMTCHCDDGAIGSLCEFKCCRDCGQFGRCEVNIEPGSDAADEFCSCHQNFTGDFCEQQRQVSDNCKHISVEKLQNEYIFYLFWQHNREFFLTLNLVLI